jgi:hypothetical protein
MFLMLTMTGGLFSTAAACRFTVMNKAHRAGTTKDAKRYLDDMFDSPFCFLGCIWIYRYEAISTGQAMPGWRGYWVKRS